MDPAEKRTYKITGPRDNIIIINSLKFVYVNEQKKAQQLGQLNVNAKTQIGHSIDYVEANFSKESEIYEKKSCSHFLNFGDHLGILNHFNSTLVTAVEN